jgi:oxalate decarboxylase/phosphoglucose isomerase-like protein (cupin superfamily)
MEKKTPPSPFGTKTTYEKWLEKEGIDIITGYTVDNVCQLKLKPWERKGGAGIFVNLEGNGQTNDAYICEIPPGEKLKPQRHLFEELIFVVQGRGATTFWNTSGQKRFLEWQTGSLFSPPLNVWHQHFNTQGDKPARYLAVTTAPTVMNLFHNHDFVFNNNFIFEDRYNEKEGYFSSQGHEYPGKAGNIWESNFIPDVNNFQLQDLAKRGAGGKAINFEISNNTLCAHISEFPLGTYKKAHRHGPGAHVIILSGEGYTLLWREGGAIERCDWHAGSIVVPPNRWFHQHFNTGRTPARYLALRWEGMKYRTGLQTELCGVSVKQGGDQIEYEDEDPSIIKMFREELDRKGIEAKMSQGT